LRSLIESGKGREAAALLQGIDLTAEFSAALNPVPARPRPWRRFGL
jgi:hypothetical protein